MAQETETTTVETSGWENVHEHVTVVDMHAHPTLKASLFGPFFVRANKRKLDKLPGPKSYRAFNPFKFRTAFPLLQAGGADVILTATAVPEAEMLPAYLGQQWLAQLVTRLPFLNRIRKRYIQPTYYESTLNSLKAIEIAVEKYAAFTRDRNSKLGEPKRRLVEVVCSVDRLKEILQRDADKPIALVHAVEGAHSLNGVIAGKELKEFKDFHMGGAKDRQDVIEKEILTNLEKLFDLGVACLTVAHFYPNYVAAPCFPYPEYALKYLDVLGNPEKERIQHDLALGLTEIGERVVKKMLNLGMLVDVTHSTPACRKRIYEIAEQEGKGYRVVATHVGASAINPDPYNLEDWEIKWLADHGGIVGVIFMNYWLQPHQGKQGLNYLSRTIEHVIEVGGGKPKGEDVIAIGTDFDGFTDPPDELAHYGLLPQLTKRLMAEYLSTGQNGKRYPDYLIEKILGGNALQVLLKGWGKRR